ncbi:MAG TPA: Flp pilus assembly protein CpaB [Alphaproteobacteria bacterium]|nr:Flp pilus assembly protein CpaB [Alphaproteobacteria bacterium]
MMRRLLFLLLALCLGGGTLLFARSWMAAEVAAAQSRAGGVTQVAGLRTVEVLVAKADMPAGQFVRPEHLTWQAWPESGLVPAYVQRGKAELDSFAGAVIRSAVVAGEPITEGRLVRPGDRGFMAAVLTPGNRAVTVPVNATSGLAGLVFPGDRVDLILTYQVFKTEDGTERRASETVLRDIRILAVDQRLDDRAKDTKDVPVAKTATLEVTPKQAEVVAVAVDLGKLSLSLRSLGQPDEPSPDLHTFTWDSDATRLLPPPWRPEAVPVAAPAPAEAAAPTAEERPAPTVSLVRAGQRESIPLAR